MAEKPSYEELERRVQDLETDNTQLKKKYTKAESFSEEIMMYMSEGLVITDTRGTVIFINQRLSEMLGYLPEEIIGKCWLDMVPGEQQAIAQEAESRRANGLTDRYEIVLCRKNGEKFPVLIGAGSRFDKQSGQYLGSMAVVNDITERKQTEEILKESETAVRKKLKAIIEPQSDLGELELADIIDVPAVQSLMEKFHQITGMLSAIVDSNGKVLVEIGWQDICKKFHRCHPETQKNCIESDITLSRVAAPGRFKSYRCKNGMWDMSTPIVVSGHHMGNIYFGQFIYSDEKPDVEEFRSQARRYGFDEAEYLATLNRVPRYDRETVEKVMAFYSELGLMISALSFSNIGLSRTLTEQKRAEKALKEKTQLLKNITDNMFDLVSLTDMEGNFTFLGASHSVLNYPLDSLIGKNVLEFVHPDDLPEISSAFHDFLLKLDDNQKIDYRYRCADGTYLWLETVGRFIRDDKDNPKEIIFSSRDITDRKQSEHELTEQKNAYRSILSTTHDGFFVANKSGKILDVNPTYLTLSGYSDEEMLNMHISDFEAHEREDEVARHIKKVMKVGSDIFESRHKRRDGSIWPVEISTTYSPLNEGRFFTFARDITARKQAQLALEQKNQEMEQFIYTVSHDLKSPLVTVKTFAGILQQDLQNSDQQQINKDLDYIDKAANKIEQLLDALLQYSRIGRVDAPAQTLSACQLVDDCLSSLAGIFQQHQVQVTTSGLTQQVQGDPLHFGQIWQNLIENAVKYRGDQPHPHIEIGATQQGHAVVFYVRDNGIGIAPDHRERIFNLFSQLNPESEGSGLGLALVKKIVSIYQGRIWVESAGEGQGSCFYFTLPGALKGNERSK